MFIPEGFTEQEVLKAIEDVVNSLANLFRFGSYEIEDLKQEGRIFAILCLPKYDASRGANIRTFMTNVVKRKFINLKRNKHSRAQIPCLTCPFYNKLRKENHCMAFDEKMDCHKWESWIKRNISKKTLSGVADDNGECVELTSDVDITDESAVRELRELIDLKLPAHMRADFRKIIDKEPVAKHRKIKIIATIKEILEESNGG